MSSMVPHPANQLDRVICQIRFPAILEIDRRIDEYQARMRGRYPGYSQSMAIPLNLANAPVPKDHVFLSEDEKWSVTLSVSALSLTTSEYTGWDDFRGRFMEALMSACEIFRIESCHRVGLRYINAIRPSSVGIIESKDSLRRPYSDLIDFKLGTPMGSNIILDYEIQDDIRGRSVVGTIQFKDGEHGILIDDDIFMESSVAVEDLPDLIDKLNVRSLEIFRMIASDDLIGKVVA